MRQDGAVFPRKAWIAGLIMLAPIGLIFFLSFGGVHAKNSPEAFNSGIEIKRVNLYCSQRKNRVYLDSLAYYGQPKGQADRISRVKVTMKVSLLKKGAKRTMARSKHVGEVEFDGDDKTIGFWHHTKFGNKGSRRIRRYALGRKSCGKGRKNRSVLARIRFVESIKRAKATGAKAADARAMFSQSRLVSKVKRVGYRACAPGTGADCDGAPERRQLEQRQPEQGQPDQNQPDQDEPQYAPCPSEGQVVGTLGSSEINEASGVVASRQNPGVLWVHNDSGDSARLFAVNTQGTLLGIYSIIGATAIDWEDIAIGPGPNSGVDYLYIGDIGDNAASRSSVSLYRVPEPEVSAFQSPQTFSLSGTESIVLHYPDGARDAETLMVDPLNGDTYVISKREARSRIYRLPYQPWTAQAQTLEYLGELSWGGAVAGEISPNGNEVIVKSYWLVFLYDRPAGTNLWDSLSGEGGILPYAPEPQGEAVAFCSLGSGYFTVSEGLNPPIYYYER